MISSCNHICFGEASTSPANMVGMPLVDFAIDGNFFRMVVTMTVLFVSCTHRLLMRRLYDMHACNFTASD